MPRPSLRILAALPLAICWAAAAGAQGLPGGTKSGVQVYDDSTGDQVGQIQTNTGKPGVNVQSASGFQKLNGNGAATTTANGDNVQNAMPETSEVDSWLISGSKSGSTQSGGSQDADGYASSIQTANTSAALNGNATLPASSSTGGTTPLDPQAGLMLQQLKTAAAIQGMASANLDAIAARIQAASDIESTYNSATSVSQLAAYNGRMAVENMIIQSQAAQAANLAAMASAQAEINRINRQQAIINDYSSMQTALGTSQLSSIPSGT